MGSLRWFVYEICKQFCIVIAAFVGVALLALVFGLAHLMLDWFGVLSVLVVLGALGLKLLSR